MKINALILSGDGINCEKETMAACQDASFDARIVHINDLLSNVPQASELFAKATLVVIPGGFSFGDELGSGKIFALKLKHGLPGLLEKHIEDGGAVLGICNGFQVLTKLGVFDRDFGERCSLLHNAEGNFINQWVELKIVGSSIFTDGLMSRGVSKLELPIRHGEGRFFIENYEKHEQEPLAKSVVLQYSSNVNGAFKNIAGVATAGGRVLGLMPHPESFWCDELHPEKNARRLPLGLELFQNAFDYLSKNRKRN